MKTEVKEVEEVEEVKESAILLYSAYGGDCLKTKTSEEKPDTARPSW